MVEQVGIDEEDIGECKSIPIYLHELKSPLASLMCSSGWPVAYSAPAFHHDLVE